MEQNQRGDMKITKPPSNLEPDRDTQEWVWYWDADDYVWGFECRTADVDIPQLTQGHFLLREDEVGRFYRKQPADLFKALEKTDMAQAYLPNGDTDKLAMDELIAIYMAAMQGFNPEPVMGYEKAKGLFTEFGGTRMHRDTLAAFGAIVDERMSQQK